MNKLNAVPIRVDNQSIMVVERKPGDFDPDLESTRVALQEQFGARARELAGKIYPGNRRELTDPES